MSTTAFSSSPPKPKPGPKKNRGGIIRSLRSALFGKREKAAKKTKQPLTAPAGAISAIVGSVRPLHVVDTGNSPDRVGMASPAPSTSSSGMSSYYSSSQSLFELDKISTTDDEMDEAEGFYDGIQGDEMIDAKAEEFIAKFYQQVRVQTPDRGGDRMR